jgi:hypothetical protein
MARSGRSGHSPRVSPPFSRRADRDEIDALVQGARSKSSPGPRIDGLMSEWEAIERELEQRNG